MDDRLIFCAGSTKAAGFARAFLEDHGVSTTDTPCGTVTHLLLDVPAFGPDGGLRGGGSVDALLSQLPWNVTICGGNLDHPALTGYKTVDLLRDPQYLAENAWITAECVLDVLLPHFSDLLRGCPVLVLGWGRIGKSLAQLLRGIGAQMTVAARKESDRAILSTLGYGAADTAELPDILPQFRLIFNTVPQLLLTTQETALCAPDCLKIDLASRPGIEGRDVITARGLPGLHRPLASGRLIARTLLHLLNKEELS